LPKLAQGDFKSFVNAVRQRSGEKENLISAW